MEIRLQPRRRILFTTLHLQVEHLVLLIQFLKITRQVQQDMLKQVELRRDQIRINHLHMIIRHFLVSHFKPIGGN